MDRQEAWRARFRAELQTSRFTLRPLNPGDLDWLPGVLADPQVCEFLLETAESPERARRYAKAIIELDLMKCHFGQWAIQDNSTGEIHGWTELAKLEPWRGPSDEIALSYVLRRESWGRGIATEAAGRLLRHAFEVHDLERVMAVTMAGNLASQRVLAKLGMRLIETARLPGGRPIVYFSIEAPGVVIR